VRVEVPRNQQTACSAITPYLSLPGIQIDDAGDGGAADGAEFGAAGEHDAIELRTVIAVALVHGAFECADLAVEFFAGEVFLLEFAKFGEERFHLLLRFVLGAKFLAALLEFARGFFVFLLVPGRGKFDAAREQVFPFEGGGIEQSGDVRFPRLDARGRPGVGDGRNVIFVGEVGEMVAEFVHENIGGLGAVRGDRAVKIEDATAAVSAGIGNDLDEFVRGELRDFSKSAIIIGKEVPFGAENVVGGAERRGAVNTGGRPGNAGFMGRRTDRPDVEIFAARFERFGGEKSIEKAPGISLEFLQLPGRVAIAENQEVDLGLRIAIVLDLDDGRGSELFRAVNIDVGGVRERRPNLAKGIFRITLFENDLRGLRGSGKAEGFVKGAVQLLRFVGRFPFAINGTETAGIEEAIAGAVAKFEEVLAEVRFVDGLVAVSRPRARFETDAIQAEEFLRSMASMEIVEAHGLWRFLSRKTIDERRKEQGQMRERGVCHAQRLSEEAQNSKG
jgi:hypothetical protein